MAVNHLVGGSIPSPGAQKEIKMPKFRVTRTWLVDAKNTTEAIDKASPGNHEEVSAIKLSSKKYKRRLTVGYRACILPDSMWNEYKGHDVLLTGRSPSGGLSALLLNKDVKGLKKGHYEDVMGEVAWINEEELEFVDSNLSVNLDFIEEYIKQTGEEDID